MKMKKFSFPGPWERKVVKPRRPETSHPLASVRITYLFSFAKDWCFRIFSELARLM